MWSVYSLLLNSLVKCPVIISFLLQAKKGEDFFYSPAFRNYKFKIFYICCPNRTCSFPFRHVELPLLGKHGLKTNMLYPKRSSKDYSNHRGGGIRTQISLSFKGSYANRLHHTPLKSYLENPLPYRLATPLDFNVSSHFVHTVLSSTLFFVNNPQYTQRLSIWLNSFL